MNSIITRILPISTIMAVMLTVLNPAVSMAQPAGPRELLRQAYVTLSFANQDYEGHRYAAMKEIEAAANILKFDLRGDGTGGERQRVSDAQLRGAKAQLDQAKAELRGRARKHVDKAMRQIDEALRVR